MAEYYSIHMKISKVDKKLCLIFFNRHFDLKEKDLIQDEDIITIFADKEKVRSPYDFYHDLRKELKNISPKSKLKMVFYDELDYCQVYDEDDLDKNSFLDASFCE